MEETAAVQGLFPPLMSDMMTLLSIALNILLMFAVAYLWATRNAGNNLKDVEEKIKKQANRIKKLEESVQEIKPHKVVDTVIEAEPFGIKPNEPREEPMDISVIGLQKFIEAYNHIAASMSVPGQLKACEKFVGDHGLRMLLYGGVMTFLPALDVEESNYWAWKIPEEQHLFAVVPNPMKPCDSNLNERGGLKMTFTTNFQDGVYKKYTVDTPAIFSDEGNTWHLRNPGVLDLARA